MAAKPAKRFKFRLGKQRWLRSAASFLLAVCIAVIYYTNRLVMRVDPAAEPYAKGEKNAVFAFWHGRLMLMPMFTPPNFPMYVLISHHRDGDLIANTIRYFKLGTVRGSSSRGGAAAGSELLKSLKEGRNISITPDGPRGPNQQVQKGVINLARLAELPIVPVSFSATRTKTLKSWDRFLVVLPFGRIGFSVGAPFFIPRNADDTEQLNACHELARRLNEATLHAEILAGLR